MSCFSQAAKESPLCAWTRRLWLGPARRFTRAPRGGLIQGGKAALLEHGVFGQPVAARRASSRPP